jgi:hypothetical protein
MVIAACPLCERRRGKRACPALGRQICAACCGAKRQTEINCPPDCGYLVSAQTHPPAIVQRQQERDSRFLLPLVAGLGQRRYHLFFLVQGAIHRLAQSGEFPVDDSIVRETAQAMAATYETASKGIIYEHRAASLPAEHLTRELKPLLEGEDGRGPVAREQDLVEVLRCIERAASEAGKALGGGSRAYLELVGRLMQPAPGREPGRPDRPDSDAARDRDAATDHPPGDPSPLIIP